MNSLKKILALFVVSALCGCAMGRRTVLEEPVGPAASPAGSGAELGGLVVHSAREIVDQVDSYHPTHSGYTLFGSDGNVLRKVRNLSGSFYADPETVWLPAGRYKLEARARNWGLVVVPVVIETGKITMVYLDSQGPQQTSADASNQWVRLPSGRIVGRKAGPPSQQE